jgi:hypothetical protein
MTTRGLRFAGKRFHPLRLSVAAGLLLALAASAAFAGPPGITASNLELAASAVAERPSQSEIADGTAEMVRPVSATVSGTSDTGEERGSTPAHGDADVRDGGKERKKALEDLVVEFLEKL